MPEDPDGMFSAFLSSHPDFGFQQNQLFPIAYNQQNKLAEDHAAIAVTQDGPHELHHPRYRYEKLRLWKVTRHQRALGSRKE